VSSLRAFPWSWRGHRRAGTFWPMADLHTRAAHPLAIAMFRVLEHRSEEDRAVVDAAARGVLGDALPERMAEVADAFCACAAHYGIEPAQVAAAKYEKWRRSPLGEGAPPEGRIRRLGGGSFADGRARALGLPRLDPTSRRLLPSQRPYQEADILRALVLFDERLAPEEPRSSENYRVWAAGYHETALERGWRIPRAGQTMVRAWGTWDDALAEAGVDPQSNNARRIAVGTGLRLGSTRPPHRSQRALLAHWAPPLGAGVEAGVGPGVGDPWPR
jgi:hypothetical protein